MTSRTMLRRGLSVGVLGVLIALCAWRSLAGAGAGQVLVLESRAVAGPLRVVVAPWAARRVVPAVLEGHATIPLDLGQGAAWPVQLRARIEIDPQKLSSDGRRLLLAGLDPSAWLASHGREALTSAARNLGSRQLLARPAALAPPVRAALAPALPGGLELRSLESAVAAAPEQARAAALSAARAALRPPVARVLHVGLDAADWEIVDRLVARGELPNFARLQREGVRADLIPFNPIVSPLLWTTVLTGRGPDEHGINDFTLQRGADAKNRVPITSDFRKVPALWEILAAAGQPMGAANHWGTEPAEQVPGVLMSDMVIRVLEAPGNKSMAGAAWPPAFVENGRAEFWTTETVPDAAVRVYVPAATDAELAEARAFLRDPARQAKWAAENEKGRRAPPVAFLMGLARTTHNVELMATRMLQRRDLGLVSVYFEDIDMVSHGFMHLDPPPQATAPVEERAEFADVVRNTYRQQDAMLGRLLALAGPDTAVIVHSDHGFQSGPRRPAGILPFTTGQPVEWHRPQGLFLAAGGPFRHGVRAAALSIFDIAPLLLALRGVPAGETMRGIVRTDLLEPGAAAQLPRDRVPTWDALVAPRQYGDADESALAEARAQALESLRGLGYVDAGDKPKPGTEAAPRPAEAPTGKPHAAVMYFRNVATFLIGENRFDEAEQALLRANEETRLPKTFQLLSECRAARSDLPGAIKALRDGFEAFPESMEPEAVSWLVELNLKAGNVPAAREAFERHRRLTATVPGLDDSIAGVLAEAGGDVASAKASFLRALERDPRDSRAAQHFAALASSAAERAELRPFLVRGLAQDYRIDVYWQMLGLFALEQGDRSGAAEAFDRAAELVPANESYQVNAANAWSRAGRFERAHAIYERLAHGATKNPDVWINLGSLRARGGDWPGARSAWERAVELGADGPELRKGLDEARRRSR